MTAAAVTRRSALALAATACAPGPGPISLPFVEAHPHILIPVTVDGRAATALLDNGVPATMIDPRFAAPDAEKRQATLGLGAGSLRIWPLVGDLTHVANTAEQPVQLLAGMEVFLRWVVALDFTTRTMTLHSPGFYSPAKDAIRLVLKPEPYRKHYVEVAVAGAPPTPAILDLGCSTALLVSERFARERGLTEGRPSSHRMAPVFVGDHMVDKILETVRLPAVSFAGETLRDVPIDILPADAGPFSGMDLVLGAPILNRFGLAFDLPRKRLYASPSPRLSEPFERRTVGISSEPEADGLRVKHVAERSPAEAAGLKAGDLVATIDGAPAGKRAIRTAKPGQRLVLELVGGGKRTMVAGYYY